MHAMTTLMLLSSPEIFPYFYGSRRRFPTAALKARASFTKPCLRHFLHNCMYIIISCSQFTFVQTLPFCRSISHFSLQRFFLETMVAPLDPAEIFLEMALISLRCSLPSLLSLKYSSLLSEGVEPSSDLCEDSIWCMILEMGSSSRISVALRFMMLLVGGLGSSSLSVILPSVLPGERME